MGVWRDLPRERLHCPWSERVENCFKRERSACNLALFSRFLRGLIGGGQNPVKLGGLGGWGVGGGLGQRCWGDTGSAHSVFLLESAEPPSFPPLYPTLNTVTSRLILFSTRMGSKQSHSTGRRHEAVFHESLRVVIRGGFSMTSCYRLWRPIYTPLLRHDFTCACNSVLGSPAFKRWKFNFP